MCLRVSGCVHVRVCEADMDLNECRGLTKKPATAPEEPPHLALRHRDPGLRGSSLPKGTRGAAARRLLVSAPRA